MFATTVLLTLLTAGAPPTSASSQAHLEFAAHQEAVNCLSYSPDGKTLVTAGWDLTAKLWDASTGQLRATLQAGAPHPMNAALARQFHVTRAVFSHDGKMLATVGLETKIWDVETGRLHVTLGLSTIDSDVAFWPDGGTLVNLRFPPERVIEDAEAGLPAEAPVQQDTYGSSPAA